MQLSSKSRIENKCNMHCSGQSDIATGKSSSCSPTDSKPRNFGSLWYLCLGIALITTTAGHPAHAIKDQKLAADSSGSNKEQTDSQRTKCATVPELGHVFGYGTIDFSSLKLTDAQRQTIQELRKENSTRSRELRKQFKEHMDEMKTLFFAPDSTAAAIRAKRNEVRKIHEKLEDIQLNDFLAVRAVLTAEQRQKLAELKAAPKQFGSKDHIDNDKKNPD